MNQPIRLWPLALLVLLLALYANFWMWDADAIVFGFPINLLYHVGVCVLASITMVVITVFGWPHELDQE